MADEQDRAEALDDDKGPFEPEEGEEERGIDLLDQTADAGPGVADEGAAEIDAGESGSSLVGVRDDPDNAADVYHVEEPPPEVAAMHVIEEEP